jgi:hypothetical protein
MKIDSRDRTVQEILGASYFRIPRFQRPYSWSVDNLEEFWSDTIVDSSGEYFIGSVIVFPAKGKAGLFDVVDGQQRITTLTVMLAALRDAYEAAGLGNRANGVHAFVERANVDDELEYILQTESSYPYLQEHVQKSTPGDALVEASSSEETALAEAHAYFTAQFEALAQSVASDPTGKDKTKALDKKLTDVRDRLLALKLILVQVDTEDDAYVIFETLNSRGKDLTTADLLKNHLMRRMPKKNKGVDLARDRWKSLLALMEESSASIDADQFLQHQWVSTRDYVSSKKLFREIKKGVTSSTAPAYLDELGSDGRLYRAILEPDYRKWTKEQHPIRSSLEALSVFGVQQPFPFVLSVLRALQTKRIKVPAAKRALRAVECFHFMFTAITGTSSSGGITKMYAAHARGVAAATNSNDAALEIDALISKLRDRVPKLEEFQANFVDLAYSTVRSQRKALVRYVLEAHYSHHVSGAAPNFSRMTIEHVSPESPAQATLHSDQVANIGNLILVDERLNDDLGNSPFSTKKAVLKKQKYVWVDPLVRSKSKWGADEISKRAEDMAKVAYNSIWKF